MAERSARSTAAAWTPTAARPATTASSARATRTPPTTAPTSTRPAIPASSPAPSARSARPACAPPGTPSPATTTCSVAGRARPARAETKRRRDRRPACSSSPDPSLRVGRTEAGISTRPRSTAPAAERAARARPRPAAPDPAPPRAHAGAGRRRPAPRGRPRAGSTTPSTSARASAPIVLDTVPARRRAPTASSTAARDRLPARRAAAPRATRWVLVFTHQPLGGFAEGAPLQALLDARPARPSPRSPATRTTTASRRGRPRRAATGRSRRAPLADFPQQTRMLRVRETAGGGAILETWMLDLRARPARRHGAGRSRSSTRRAGGRTHDAGTRLDRNVRLYRAAPSRPPQATSATSSARAAARTYDADRAAGPLRLRRRRCWPATTWPRSRGRHPRRVAAAPPDLWRYHELLPVRDAAPSSRSARA